MTTFGINVIKQAGSNDYGFVANPTLAFSTLDELDKARHLVRQCIGLNYLRMLKANTLVDFLYSKSRSIYNNPRDYLLNTYARNIDVILNEFCNTRHTLPAVNKAIPILNWLAGREPIPYNLSLAEVYFYCEEKDQKGDAYPVPMVMDKKCLDLYLPWLFHAHNESYKTATSDMSFEEYKKGIAAYKETEDCYEDIAIPVPEYFVPGVITITSCYVSTTINSVVSSKDAFDVRVKNYFTPFGDLLASIDWKDTKNIIQFIGIFSKFAQITTTTNPSENMNFATISRSFVRGIDPIFRPDNHVNVIRTTNLLKWLKNKYNITTEGFTDFIEYAKFYFNVDVNQLNGVIQTVKKPNPTKRSPKYPTPLNDDDTDNINKEIGVEAFSIEEDFVKFFPTLNEDDEFDVPEEDAGDDGETETVDSDSPDAELEAQGEGEEEEPAEGEEETESSEEEPEEELEDTKPNANTNSHMGVVLEINTAADLDTILFRQELSKLITNILNNPSEMKKLKPHQIEVLHEVKDSMLGIYTPKSLVELLETVLDRTLIKVNEE